MHSKYRQIGLSFLILATISASMLFGGCIVLESGESGGSGQNASSSAGDLLSMYLVRHSAVPTNTNALAANAKSELNKSLAQVNDNGNFSLLNYAKPQVLLPSILALAGDEELQYWGINRAELSNNIRANPEKYWQREPGSLTKSHLYLFDDKQMNEIGLETEKSILEESEVIQSGAIVTRVKNIADRIYNALPKDTQKMFVTRRVYVLKTDVVNACCLPNGTIFVNSGLVNFAKNDDEIATVMGHEVAHFTKQHTNERCSMMIMSVAAENMLRTDLNKNSSELSPLSASLKSFVALAGYDLTAKAGELAFSRSNETEADETGLRYMANAGFNPRNGIVFWERMIGAGGSGSSSKWQSFFSTHPADGDRLKNLTKLCNTIEAEKKK